MAAPSAKQGLPELLLPYMRLAHATDAESLKAATLDTCCAAPISSDNERTVLQQLAMHLQDCLGRHACTLLSWCTFATDCRKYSRMLAPVLPCQWPACVTHINVLCRYRTSIEEDEAIVASSSAGPRQKVAARLVRIEKTILSGVPRCSTQALVLMACSLITSC